MQFGRFGKTNSLAGKTLEARPPCQLFPLNLLGIAFARHMGLGGQMPGLRPPLIGEEACDPKGR
jgi:hypothetical protein